MGRLKKQAASQARSEYLPQKQQVRQTTQSSVRSLRSLQPALEGSIATAEQQLRHAGLNGHDLRMALAELAHRNVDVGSSTALQIGNVQREGQQDLVDLNQSQSAAAAASLASLQAAAAEHRQSIQDAIAGEQRGLVTAVKQKALEQQLGLSGSSNGGLTPTQQRDAHSEHHAAAFYAHQLIREAKDGIYAEVKNPDTGETEKKLAIPRHPSQYTDDIWNGLVEKVASKKGIDNIAAAQKAVQALRDHFQPAATTSGVVDALQTEARAAAPAVPGLFGKILQAAGG